MTIGKSNRVKAYIEEIDQIEYILDDRRLDQLKRSFYELRYSQLRKYVAEYLNNNAYERTEKNANRGSI